MHHMSEKNVFSGFRGSLDARSDYCYIYKFPEPQFNVQRVNYLAISGGVFHNNRFLFIIRGYLTFVFQSFAVCTKLTIKGTTVSN